MMKRLALIGLMLVVAVAFGSSAAAASTETEQPNQFAKITVEPLTQVSWQQGLTAPAVVVVSTERPVSGRLTIVDDPEGGSSTVWEFDVDLAAGNEISLPIQLTTGWQGLTGTASLVSGNQVVASTNIREMGQGEGGVGVVGMLGIADPPVRVNERATENSLPTLALDSSLSGLGLVSSVVATPIAVRELGSDTASSRTLLGWVQGGGQLIVDGPPGSLGPSLAGVPTANQQRQTLGAGSVVYTEDWREGIPLGGFVGGRGLARLLDRQNIGYGSEAELAAIAGIGYPSAWLIGGVLLGYALLAGPILFTLSRSRRSPRMVWLAVPALSLAVAVGLTAFGVLSRSGRSSGHVTIAEVNDSGSRASSYLLVTSGLGGETAVQLPEGWSYAGRGAGFSSRALKIRPSASSAEVAADLPPGGLAAFQAAGEASMYDGMLTIGSLDGGSGEELTGQVTNNTDVDLESAVVFLGNERLNLGDIPARSTVDFAIDSDRGGTRTMGELLIWPQVRQDWSDFDGRPLAVPTDPGVVAAPATWSDWRVQRGPSSIGYHTVSVVAWSDELPSPLSNVPVGRTGVVARADVAAALPDTHYGLEYRLPTNDVEPEFMGNEGIPAWSQDYRVTFGPDADLSDAALSISRDAAGLGVWTGEAWEFVQLPDDNQTTWAIPTEAVHDGELIARSWVPDWAWDAGLTVGVTFDDEAVELPLQTDLVFRQSFDGRQEFFGPDAMDMNMFALDVLDLSPADLDIGLLEFEGVLEPQSYVGYRLPLLEGQAIVVNMGSQTGDAFLVLVDQDGQYLIEDDDSGNGTNSRIAYEAGRDETVEVRAQGLGGEPLDYTLTVEVQQ